MPRVLTQNRFESVKTVYEFAQNQDSVHSAVIIPGRLAVNVCISPVEEIESAESGNEFMNSFIPSDQELNGNARSLRVHKFEEKYQLLRLGRIGLADIDAFVQFEDYPAPHLTDGDAKGVQNVFGQRCTNPRAADPTTKLLFVRFFPSDSHLQQTLNTGENLETVPLFQLSHERQRAVAEGRIQAIERTLKPAS